MQLGEWVIIIIQWYLIKTVSFELPIVAMSFVVVVVVVEEAVITY